MSEVYEFQVLANQTAKLQGYLRRIAAECTFIDERGAVGICLQPAAEIVRQYGEQFRRPPRRKQNRGPKPPPLL